MKNRVLIISHNPISNKNNMGKTLLALFNSFNKDEIVQLYLYSGHPDANVCSSYYNITDMDMLKSHLGRDNTGEVVDFDSLYNNSIEKRSNNNEMLYKIGKLKTPTIYLLRDYIWNREKWFNQNIKEWLKGLDITSVFYASGDSCFSYNIALKISDFLNANLYTYFCDDFYFFSKLSVSPLYYVYRKRLKYYTRQIVEKSKGIIFISSSMKDAYKKEFGKEGEVILTPSINILTDIKTEITNRPIVMTYMGNVSLRLKPLLEISDIIKIINKDKQLIVFRLYTLENRNCIINRLKNNEGIEFNGSVSSNQVNRLTIESDIMLHVESFNKRIIRRVKHSISTKIPEILGYGKCIFAYGPMETASIDYLSSNNAAHICIIKNDLQSKLEELIHNRSLRLGYEKQALKLAKTNHDQKVNSQKLKSILFEVGESIQL